MEFCSDMFLLPLGVPPIDSIDLGTNSYLRNPKPEPPPRNYIPNIIPKSADLTYYELLLNKLEFNNNDYVANVLSTKPDHDAPVPPTRHKLEPIFESHESEEFI